MSVAESLRLTISTSCVIPSLAEARLAHALSFYSSTSASTPPLTVTRLLAIVDSLPMAKDPVLNPYSTGYVTEETVMQTSGTADADPFKARFFKMINL